jgi:predicted DNA-binding transcriptional regulator AlpA
MSLLEKLLTAREVCEILRIHIQTLYNRVRNDPEFPKPIRYKRGGRLAWRESVIEKYIKQLEKAGA